MGDSRGRPGSRPSSTGSSAAPTPACPSHRGRIRNPIGANMSMRATVLAAGRRVRSATRSRSRRARRSPVPPRRPSSASARRSCTPASTGSMSRGARVRHHVPPQRATWRYFVRRCVVEGTSKAQLDPASPAPTTGCAPERRVRRSVLPRAVLRDLVAGVRGRREGFARAGCDHRRSRDHHQRLPVYTRRSETKGPQERRPRAAMSVEPDRPRRRGGDPRVALPLGGGCSAGRPAAGSSRSPRRASPSTWR